MSAIFSPASVENDVMLIEHHLHSHERWFGAANVPAGETHIADRIFIATAPFTIDAGNNDWSVWMQILGSSDTPADVGMVLFDFHRILFTAAERNATYLMQVAFGVTGAAGFDAGEYTETVFQPASNQIDSGPILVQNDPEPVGIKVWMRIKAPAQDTGTLSFYIGVHEYPVF